jgi:hypothetical protein
LFPAIHVAPLLQRVASSQTAPDTARANNELRRKAERKIVVVEERTNMMNHQRPALSAEKNKNIVHCNSYIE